MLHLSGRSPNPHLLPLIPEEFTARAAQGLPLRHASASLRLLRLASLSSGLVSLRLALLCAPHAPRHGVLFKDQKKLDGWKKNCSNGKKCGKIKYQINVSLRRYGEII